tara:strand:+ start:311 stop:1597 length:1287 start_codon:yes stop_codon:yes gene_type:complete
MEIPNINHHSIYISFWKKLYEEQLNQTKEPNLNDLKLFKQHLAENIEKLRHIKDDDFFEWNHAMIVFIVISMYQIKLQPHLIYNVNDIELLEWQQKNNVITKKINKLSDVILILEHIDDRWTNFNLNDLHILEHFIEEVYTDICPFIHNAANITKYNRWNLLQEMPVQQLYRVKTSVIMQFTCKQAWHVQNLNIGKILNTLEEKNDITISKEEEYNFIKWAINEKTYFSIRKFRTRITTVIWRFLDNLPSRWLHTYNMTGEEPTVYAHVSSKYPSPWINSINHNVLYSKPEILLQSNNPLITEATIFALVEAYFRTLHNFNWTTYCFCNDYDIKKNMQSITSSKFPIVIRYWKKFAVIYKNTIYKTDTIAKTFLLWLKLIKNKCEYIILENINLFNTYNTMIPVEKSNTSSNNNIKIINQEKVFEINL